jgi:hypothetical protein
MAMNRPRPIQRRLFVVGCSRSGTTLAQRLLVGHSRVHTYPETGVFLKMLGMRGHVLPWVHLGLTAGKERKALASLLANADGEVRGIGLPPRRVLLRRSAADVVAVLDELARRAGTDIWLEKTPRHVYHAARIQPLVPRSVCIHVVRNGEDVVASIVDRARRFPDRFKRQQDPGYGIRQWNRSMAATEAAMRGRGQVVVRYEVLASDPAGTLRALCSALELEFEEAMLDTPSDASFVAEGEAWKSQVTAPVAPAASKFTDLFDETIQARIRRRLRHEFFREVERRTEGESRGVWVSDLGL